MTRMKIPAYASDLISEVFYFINIWGIKKPGRSNCTPKDGHILSVFLYSGRLNIIRYN